MANDPHSAADLLVINNANAVDLGLSGVLDDAPFLAALPATTASYGSQHDWVERTQNPVVGLRDPNTGRDVDSSINTNRSITLKVLDASFWADVALASAYKMGVDAYLERELAIALRAAFSKAEKAIINGTGDTAAFLGLFDKAPYTDSTQGVNAGGTTASTASSVYLVRAVPDLSEVAVILGADGEIDVQDPTVIAAPGGSDTSYPSFYVAVSGWLGLQHGSAYSVVRIMNLTEDSGKGLTDDLLSLAMSKFPASRMPTHIVMNRRSRRQLRDSRTTYSPTGSPAVNPIEFDGVPIYVTDSILSTEAVASTAP